VGCGCGGCCGSSGRAGVSEGSAAVVLPGASGVCIAGSALGSSFGTASASGTVGAGSKGGSSAAAGPVCCKWTCAEQRHTSQMVEPWRQMQHY
jgi:hypothetical protein